MRIKIAIAFALSFYCVSNFYAQENLIALTISPELTKDANAVVRENYIEVNIEAIDEMIVKERRVTTVLNKLGNKHVGTYASYNNHRKITDLSVKVYNSFGKQIDKYSKSKFTDVSAVDGGTLYSDSRVKYIDYTPTEYPYTIVFEKEYKTPSTGFIPEWHPIDSYYVSVEKSEYKINNPNNIETRVKEKNFENYSVKRVSEEDIHFVAKNIPAIEYERNSIDFSEISPSLSVALNQFTLKGVSGSGTDWKEFGKWMNTKLLEGRTELSPATIEKAKSLVSGIDNDVEKAKKIYEFVQSKTRYISVQVGIGGWEPIPANEVDKMGYGDCKGLTNYTKALLDVVGVESYHTLVYANDRKDIDKDFSSLQGNHMILNIPNNGNDIWLECTNQSIPFGFLGDFTDDRNVLVVTPEGGIIKRTPSYKNEANLQTCKADIKIDKSGNIEAEVEITSQGVQYNDKYGIDNLAQDDLEKYYKSKIWSYNNNLEIKSSELENNKNSIVFKEKLNVSIADYASITANELLVRVNVFNRNSFVPKRYRTRNHPLQIKRGYKDVDDFTFTIPEGYKINTLPPKVEISTKFGSYFMEIKKIDDKTVSYHKTLLIKEGTHPKEDYKLYRKFRKRIAKKENLRIALQRL
jgi:transglutaminase-like putative cysteine protease